ncbi:MAG: response regulator [Thermodesulfobacteriota bacterium]
MKTILIVDDTKLARSFIAKKLEPFADEFSVLTAGNGQEALDLAQTVKIDLVITDIEMPVMDGFELLANLNNKYPQIPVFVMTAKGSPEIEQRIDALGSLKYFEKPMDLEALVASIRETLDSSAQGKVNGISLASFLQLVGMENKSCTLRIKSGKLIGELYCLQGQLIAAETGNLKGEEAVIEMITWDAAVIEILKFNKQKEKEIKKPLMNILMEASRRMDEKQAAKKEEKEAPKPKPVTKEQKPDAKTPPAAKKIDPSTLYEWD